MRYPPSLLEEIRARLPVSQVVARKVQLKRQGREYRGLSPFKQERTPSFYVNDAKSSWFDFSSGQNGDIFKFVMLTEGLSFPEAIERLAEEAGVALPKDGPRDQVREDTRTRLMALMETACKFFEDTLRSAQGSEGRKYIDKRGVGRATVARFRMGYAPNSKTALKECLAKAGFSVAEMAEAGMVVHGADIPVPYDRFRHRVIIPITDPKDRVIAFGGRALDPAAPAKYLNSPETPLFHKGSVLFNAAKARGPAHDKGEVIAVEGYMDVIALVEGGFENAVAPLGTALTEDQLRLLWRLCPEPTLCFDGDGAGRKAAFRAVETALPHLKPGASLKFAFLPDTYDPDDLIRQEGPVAMREVLDRTRPLSEVLWEREWGAGDWSTPERRAALEKQLQTLVARIQDDSVRGHYERNLSERLTKEWGAAPQTGRGFGARSQGGSREPWRGHGGGAGKGAARWPAGGKRDGRGQPWRNGTQFGPPPGASSSLKHSKLVSGGAAEAGAREAVLILTVLNHPWLIDEHAEEIAALPFTNSALARLRDAVLGLHAWKSPLDSDELRHQLTGLGLERHIQGAERALTHRGDRFVLPTASKDEVSRGWRETAGFQSKQKVLRPALEAAANDLVSEGGDETSLARLREIGGLLNEPVENGSGGAG